MSHPAQHELRPQFSFEHSQQPSREHSPHGVAVGVGGGYRDYNNDRDYAPQSPSRAYEDPYDNHSRFDFGGGNRRDIVGENPFADDSSFRSPMPSPSSHHNQYSQQHQQYHNQYPHDRGPPSPGPNSHLLYEDHIEEHLRDPNPPQQLARSYSGGAYDNDRPQLSPSAFQNEHPRALTPGPRPVMDRNDSSGDRLYNQNNGSSSNLGIPSGSHSMHGQGSNRGVGAGVGVGGSMQDDQQQYWNRENNNGGYSGNSRGPTPTPQAALMAPPASSFSSDPHQSYDESRYLQERFGRDTSQSTYSSHYGAGGGHLPPHHMMYGNGGGPGPSNLIPKASMSSFSSGGQGPFNNQYADHGDGYSNNGRGGGGGGPVPPMHQSPYQHSNASGRILTAGPIGDYQDNPYKRYSTTWDPMLASSVGYDGANDRNLIVDDDDDYGDGRGNRGPGGAAAAGGLVGGGVMGAVKRASQTLLPHRNSAGSGSALGTRGAPTPLGERASNVGLMGPAAGVPQEKSEWMKKESKGKKKSKWIVAAVILVLALIAGGVAAALILTKKDGGSGGTKSASGSTEEDLNRQASPDDDERGLLDKNSREIKALMSNKKLKKIFHGIDYTPMGTQYPDCEKWPPSQNNVTRDIAVMSLMTDKIRLYGNDCQQTEMVMEAIKRLDVKMGVWIGVWLDNNSTTNTRQINELWSILDNYKDDVEHFEGVAVGNEVLYRKDLTEWELREFITEVRDGLKKRGIKLPVGSSDLGSNWNADFAASVDVLMANIHPFFGGVKAEDAAEWTDEFFQNNNVYIVNQLKNKPRVMISEVGWPTEGGRKQGSVAGVPELNRFMKDFVCKENKKGTEYFWFSAFDEPWKVRYNSPGMEWEDKWGLLDVNRNIKPGLEFPDC